MRVLYVGPFEANGVYKGGITGVVQGVMKEYNCESNDGEMVHEYIPVNCNLIKRNPLTQGKLNYENVRNTILIYKELISKIKKTGASCIYYNSSNRLPLLKDLMILYAVKKKCKVKTIVHIHYADYHEIIYAKYRLDKLIISILQKMDGLVFLSKKTRDDFVNHGFKKNKTCVIYNYHNIDVDEDRVSSKLANIKKKPECKMIFIGAVTESKGIFDLLDAIVGLPFDYTLDICGLPTDINAKKRLDDILNSSHTRHVRYNGYISGEEKKDILLQNNILVLPSYGEGFPLVLLEGIAAGCAVITTPVGAIPEVFSEETGSIVNTGDVNGLRKAIIELQSRDLHEICSENFQLSKNFSAKKCLDEMNNFISRVCR